MYIFFTAKDNSRMRNKSCVAGGFTNIHDTDTKNAKTQTNDLWITLSVVQRRT